MGDGYIELSLSGYLEEALLELDEGTAAFGIGRKVLASESLSELSAAQRAIWNQVIWPAVGRVQARHQRYRFENLD